MKWPINQEILFKDQPALFMSSSIHQRKIPGINKITDKYALQRSIHPWLTAKAEQRFASFHSFGSPSVVWICILRPHPSFYFYKQMDAAPHRFHQKTRNVETLVFWFSRQTKVLRHCPNLALCSRCVWAAWSVLPFHCRMICLMPQSQPIYANKAHYLHPVDWVLSV